MAVLVRDLIRGQHLLHADADGLVMSYDVQVGSAPGQEEDVARRIVDGRYVAGILVRRRVSVRLDQPGMVTHSVPHRVG
jgi:hypothetical protein